MLLLDSSSSTCSFMSTRSAVWTHIIFRFGASSRPWDKGVTRSSRPLDKGGARWPKKFFSALRDSGWSKNKEGARARARAPPLDPMRFCFCLCRFSLLFLTTSCTTWKITREKLVKKSQLLFWQSEIRGKTKARGKLVQLWTLLTTSCLLPPRGFRPEGEIPRRHSSNSRVY